MIQLYFPLTPNRIENRKPSSPLWELGFLVKKVNQ